jgi:hypothetical protein
MPWISWIAWIAPAVYAVPEIPWIAWIAWIAPAVHAVHEILPRDYGLAPKALPRQSRYGMVITCCYGVLRPRVLSWVVVTYNEVRVLRY